MYVNKRLPMILIEGGNRRIGGTGGSHTFWSWPSPCRDPSCLFSYSLHIARVKNSVCSCGCSVS